MREYYIKEIDAYIRYQDFHGEETPILFIHGLGCAGSFDYPQVATDSKLVKHRCILIDLLGANIITLITHCSLSFFKKCSAGWKSFMEKSIIWTSSSEKFYFRRKVFAR